MDCIAILDSNSYLLSLSKWLEKKGYSFEVISIPTEIARTGCGYCMKFPCEYKDMVIKEGISRGLPVRKMYSIAETEQAKRYKRIY